MITYNLEIITCQISFLSPQSCQWHSVIWTSDTQMVHFEINCGRMHCKKNLYYNTLDTQNSCQNDFFTDKFHMSPIKYCAAFRSCQTLLLLGELFCDMCLFCCLNTAYPFTCIMMYCV